MLASVLLGASIFCRARTNFVQHGKPSNIIFVEWRALTVALLGRLFVLVRYKLSLDEQRLSLASIL